MARKKRGPGFIYLIHATESPHYKIGHAVDVSRRLWQINQHNPSRCVLVHAMPIDRQNEAEMFWHKLFEHTRVKGEWFVLTEAQIALFCACKGGNLIELHYQVYRDNQVLFMAVMDESK